MNRPETMVPRRPTLVEMEAYRIRAERMRAEVMRQLFRELFRLPVRGIRRIAAATRRAPAEA